MKALPVTLASPWTALDTTSSSTADDAWLAAFHAGDRRVLEQVYREHFAIVDARVGRVLWGADRDTVVQEVFCRLVADAGMRKSFRGGKLAAWLNTVAGNAAIDHVRKYGRERPLSEAGEGSPEDPSDEMVAQIMMRRFRAAMPPEWLPVFEARFVRQLSQREAAAELGLVRTTLVYRELRIRALLKKLAEEEL
jgi:RNA polymerase sigma-70 factor (ECF subfamily)